MLIIIDNILQYGNMGSTESVCRIFHVDDDKIIRDAIANIAIAVLGGRVVLSASDVDTALSYIPDKLRELKVDVAIIDGRLLKKNTERSGEEIAEAIRASDYPIPVIAFSADRQTWGDFNVEKGHRPTEDLQEAFDHIRGDSTTVSSPL